jgi:hypothetical protein
MDREAFSAALDFTHRTYLSHKVCSTFSAPIHPSSEVGFHLVISFGRAKFRLDLANVGVALHSFLGSDGASLRIIHLCDRVFKFTVISKAIGFFIYCLRSFIYQEFVCYFHLWGSGGAN